MRTAHRMAARAKHQELPKFWRKKIDPSQQLDCKLTHWSLLERMLTGQADRETLWDWMETGFTYSQMMRLLAADGLPITTEAEQVLAEQLGIYEDVAARYRKTGRVGFTGQQIQIARAACHVMDLLIEADRHGIAVQAATWSLEQMQRIRREMQ